MPTTDQDQLVAMIEACHPCISVITYEEEHALDVVRQAVMEGRRDLLIRLSDILLSGRLGRSCCRPEPRKRDQRQRNGKFPQPSATFLRCRRENSCEVPTVFLGNITWRLCCAPMTAMNI